MKREEGEIMKYREIIKESEIKSFGQERKYVRKKAWVKERERKNE